MCAVYWLQSLANFGKIYSGARRKLQTDVNTSIPNEEHVQ